MTRVSDPQISFADLEFLHQNVQLDPVLQSISDFIESHVELIELVRQDLERGLKKPATGRNGLSALQVLRSLALQRVKNWVSVHIATSFPSSNRLGSLLHRNQQMEMSSEDDGVAGIGEQEATNQS